MHNRTCLHKCCRSGIGLAVVSTFAAFVATAVACSCCSRPCCTGTAAASCTSPQLGPQSSMPAGGLPWTVCSCHAGISLPAQQVEESWNSAQFWANKVCCSCNPLPPDVHMRPHGVLTRLELPTALLGATSCNIHQGTGVRARCTDWLLVLHSFGTRQLTSNLSARCTAWLQVLTEFRSKDAQHVEWVKALKELFDQLKAYVKQHHVAGPAWNRNGAPVSQFKLAEGGGVPAAAAGVLLRLLHKPYIKLTEERRHAQQDGWHAKLPAALPTWQACHLDAWRL